MSLYNSTPKDDQITILCTTWTTPSVTVVGNSYRHAGNHKRMHTVPKSEAEILNSLKDRDVSLIHD